MAEGPEHRTLFYGDCLSWMADWPDACVDLIYLDPPFNSNANYNILFGEGNGRPAQVRGFEDTWRWDDAAIERSLRLEGAAGHPAHRAAVALKSLLGPSGMLAYATYMAERLAEMRRILKPTGAIYLHCDDTAVSYLGAVMDSLFGRQNRMNLLTWRRSTRHSDARRFGRVLDYILFYRRSEEWEWNEEEALEQVSEAEIARKYPSEDERGRYRTDNLTGPRHRQPRGAPSTLPWHGYDVHGMGRVWSAPLTGAYARYIDEHLIPGYLEIEGVHERLEALDGADLIVHPEAGRWPGLKRYADADIGQAPTSSIDSPTGFTNYSTRGGEYLGFPTQKPVALLEQLIRPASRAGDLVLDPFCGCGTSMVAAENLGRRWAGVDISSTAIDIVQQRRLRPLQIEAEIRGIPIALREARRLARDNPLDFEAWAVMRIAGMAANERQRGDGGIDGRGMLSERARDHASRLVLAQVAGGRFSLSKFREFLAVLEREEAACGVYITLDRATSPRARREAAGKGTLRIGASEFPRVQLWSIAEHFQGRQPELPVLNDPYTGAPAQLTMIRAGTP